MSNETSYPNSPENIASYERDGATGRRRQNQAGHAGVGFGIATGSGGEKPIPHNPEAEEAVIGSLLIDRDTIIKIAPLLRPADFFSEERASVYEAVLELYEQRIPGDLITLRDELRRRGKLGEGEGQVKASYLLDLMRSTATPVHVEHYARIVLRYAIMRRLIGAGAQVTALGFDEKLQTQDMVDQAQQIVLDVIQQGIKRDAVKVGAALEEYFDRLSYLHEHRGELVGVPSGYSDLDKLTGGFQRSDLVILAARPATGKTSLALGFAYNAALKHKRPVGLFSLEMSREQLVQRMLAMETGVDSHRLRTGYIDENEWDRISRAFGKLATAPLYIDDSAGMSIQEVRSKARRLHAEYGIELLIIDYLQLMAGTSNKIENRVQEVSEISRNLKGMARELDIPVICLSQLSRAVESRTSHVPQLSDLRDSGCLAGETLIYLPDSGTYQRIDSLVGQTGFNVSAVNTDSWQIESRQVVNAFSTGVKPVFKMTTRLGRTIRATANHQFLTIEGWQRLDALNVGMRLATPRQLNIVTEPVLQLAGVAANQTQERAGRVAEVVGSAELKNLATSDVYWDEIISIEPDGETEVYDLTVDGLHNFTANDIIAHNSIEQDADIVMFIYREELYNPETEKKNIAEIHVAKHRNGPVDVVPLFFHNKTTRFADCEPYRTPGR